MDPREPDAWKRHLPKVTCMEVIPSTHRPWDDRGAETETDQRWLGQVRGWAGEGWRWAREP